MSNEQKCIEEVERLERKFKEAYKESLLETFDDMVKRCPVKTGRLRKGIYLWTQKRSYVPPPAPDDQLDYYDPPDRPTILSVDRGKFVFGNNVPYAEIADIIGWTRKGPTGFMLIPFNSFKDRLSHKLK